MTYGELSYKAKELYTKGKITICEYLEMTKPLDREIEQEPKTGHWIKVTNGRGGHECDICHEYAPSYQSGNEYLTKYCPNCGAKMKVGD